MLIKVYKECQSVYDKVGLVLQAYLKRSVDDLKLLSKQSLNSRICKGIYNESSQISFNSRISINENYIKMAKLMHQSGSYAAYATHDQNLIDELLSWIKANKISKSSFEFQVLYGVPMQGRLEQLINQGYKKESLDEKLNEHKVLELKDSSWDNVRKKRDYLLKSSDWTMNPDTTVDQAQWSAYRQILRDLPQTYKDKTSDDVVWPTQPSTAGPNT